MSAMRSILATSFCLAASCGDPPPLRVGVVFNAEGGVGARIAAAEINATGGIRGRPLVLQIEGDSGTNARPAVLTAERLARDDHVIAVVGHSNSNASLAAAQVYNSARVVQIAPSSSSPSLNSAGSYTFRLVASDIHQARFIAGEVDGPASKPRVAVLFVNDDYGRSLFNEIRSQFEASRTSVVFDATFAANDTLSDAHSTAKAIADARTTHLVWLGRSFQLRQLLPLLRRALPQLQVIASDGVDQREVFINSGGVFTGVRYACFVNDESSRPELARLRMQYAQRTGGRLTSDAALAYEAVMLIAHAARELGPERDNVRRYLHSLGRERPAYRGAVQDIAFDTTGAAQPSYCLKEVTPEGPRVVDPRER